MAAVIRIEIATAGGVDEVKKDVADLGKAAEASGAGFSALREIGIGALREIGAAAVNLAISGFQAIGGAISDGIADAQNYAIIAAQTDAVIKSTGGAAGVSAEQVAEYAGALSDAAGASLFGDDQIQQSTNMLLTFTEIKGKVLDAATAITVDMAQALGGEPKDAAIQLGKALNDPIKGITALTRVGVTFTEEQKAQIQAMQEAGDMAGAQGVILAELNKEFGGSAQAAADATGGWSEFNGRMGEAKETMGAAVLPLLGMLVDVLLTSVLPVIEGAAGAFALLVQYFQAVVEDGDTMNDFLADLPEGFQPIIQAAGNVVVAVQGLAAAFSAWLGDPATQEGIRQIGDAITNGLNLAFTVLTTQIIPALVETWNTIQPALNAVVAFISNNLQPIIAGLAAVFVTVVVPAFVAWAVAAGAAAIATITALAPVIIPIVAIGAAVALLKAAWDSNFGGIKTTLTTFWETTGRPIFDILKTWLDTNLPIALQALSDYWTDVLQPALKQVWDFIQAYVMPLLSTLVSVHIAAVSVAISALAALWSGVLLPALKAIWDFISTYVIPIFKGLVEVHIKALVAAFQGLADFWKNTFVPAMTAVYNFINDTLAPKLATLNSNVLQPMAKFFSDIGEAVAGLIQQIDEFINKIADVVIPDWLQGQSPPPMADWFSWIADGVSAVNAQLPALQANLAVAASPSGVSSISNASSRSFTYAPNISTSGNVDGPMDLALANSLAGV